MDFVTTLLISIGFGLIFAAIIYSLFAVVFSLFFAPARSQKIIKDKSYNTVTASLNKETSQYTYWVNDKQYNYNSEALSTLCELPPKIKLYYRKEPQKAISDLSRIGEIENHMRIVARLWFSFSVSMLVMQLISG